MLASAVIVGTTIFSVKLEKAQRLEQAAPPPILLNPIPPAYLLNRDSLSEKRHFIERVILRLLRSTSFFDHEHDQHNRIRNRNWLKNRSCGKQCVAHLSSTDTSPKLAWLSLLASLVAAISLAALLCPAALAQKSGPVTGVIDGVSFEGDQYYVHGWACQEGNRGSIVSIYTRLARRAPSRPERM